MAGIEPPAHDLDDEMFQLTVAEYGLPNLIAGAPVYIRQAIMEVDDALRQFGCDWSDVDKGDSHLLDHINWAGACYIYERFEMILDYIEEQRALGVEQEPLTTLTVNYVEQIDLS